VRNPWLEIPLSDYEGHMELPQIGQAEMLAEVTLPSGKSFAVMSFHG
jgi:hypothetical protein